ncbi:3-deoxy-D-arabino-heptulosonate 7-phosphate synthase [Paraburkholderia acidisoli]|uniref:3-deoxy-D-arabino-heptulosonate 7-phosphate synthase n=2 Tax=Paraburkholderia acidisoli TaxID=2571748 RepID=A0A7Z2JHL2_9BURK|nr:3-deoxy-D-arabino-heptulosonate 7-phosphate synthase [Paraburkholderia acidisoli]QGZ64866.1 3-deoxy-D-arabino-heptulosonate 7-phosphate synthase [Paraburkholderia acidisoli]
MPAAPLLAAILRSTARRYRLPPLDTPTDEQDAHDTRPTRSAPPATVLAIAIEHARRALARNEAPGPHLERTWVAALAALIREALRDDTVFQAMLLRHRDVRVREYASLSAHAEQDRRSIYANVNAIAHPARLARIADTAQREALAQVQASASAMAWPALHAAARALFALPDLAHESELQRGLARLVDNPALPRLQRLNTLATHAAVQQYEALWDRQGPRPGSADAMAQGSASQQRGAAVEALAAQALSALAARLDAAEGERGRYRVVTSMRVPAAIPASAERAKSEWDAVLLRRADTSDTSDTSDTHRAGEAAGVWDVCLLVEAKASIDAATTDFPRLLRGLRLLAHARAHETYAFDTRQGAVRLNGAALHALSTGEAAVRDTVLYCSDAAAVRDTVLYCSDAAAETAPRLLGAASRMQLLSAPASLAFASAIAEGRTPDTALLHDVWRDLLASPRWATVRDQYPMLDRVRGLMVHADDLAAAAAETMPEA